MWTTVYNCTLAQSHVWHHNVIITDFFSSFQCQRDSLLSCPSNQMYPAFARRWVCGDTRACLCDIKHQTTAMQYLPQLRKLPLTGYNECWMLPPESSVTPGSLTMVSRDWCTRSYTGWTSLSESVTSWACWRTWPTCVCSAQCTCSIIVSWLSKSQHVGIYTLLHIISWPFCDIVLALAVIGHSLSLVRWRSMLCQMIPLSAQQHNVQQQ